MKLATLCYLRHKGQTLMMHRIKKKNDMHEGKWNGLGGKMERGETPEACVIREMKEECGLHIFGPILKGFLTFPGFSEGEDWYVFVFLADRFEGELIESNEGVLSWIDNDKVLNLPLWEGDHIFLPWLDQPRFFSAKFKYQNKILIDHKVVFYPA